MERSLRIAWVIPDSVPEHGGNRISAGRLERGLADRGIEGKVLRVSAAESFPDPDLIHVFNAYKAGVPVLDGFGCNGRPLVVSLTGTDVNHYLQDPQTRDGVRRVLAEADAIVAYHPALSQAVTGQVTAAAEKVVTIAPAADPWIFPGDRNQTRRKLGIGEDRFLVLFPNGLRSVKDPLFVLRAVERIRSVHPEVALVYAGADRDTALAMGIKKQLRGRSWAVYLGEVPHQEMDGLYQAADAVVNSSLSEGVANALLEAMAAGCVVLARNIEGNRVLVADGRTGFLFADEDTLAARIRLLLEEPALRQLLGRNARQRVLTEFPIERELDAYERLYRCLVKCN